MGKQPACQASRENRKQWLDLNLYQGEISSQMNSSQLHGRHSTALHCPVGQVTVSVARRQCQMKKELA